jgi:hypothetical protein
MTGLRLHSSTVAGRKPAADTARARKMAVNFADRKLYVTDAAGDAQEFIAVTLWVSTGLYPAGSFAATPDGKISRATIAVSPGPFVASQWQPITSSGATISSVPPSTPSTGDLWFDLGTNTLKIWLGSSWTGVVNMGWITSQPIAATPPTTLDSLRTGVLLPTSIGPLTVFEWA